MYLKNRIVSHNGSNYDYLFIIKELAEEKTIYFFWGGGNIENCIPFTVPIEKEVTRIDKNGENLTKNIYQIFIYINIYKILSLIFLKKFIELKVNSNMMIKNVKNVKLNISIATVFLNIQILKMI